ncbi:MAG: hypothetical protein GY718_04585 [Lentisphaerae bacterium]|nr:hypothetical protein [Lentisphaerota bacterium]
MKKLIEFRIKSETGQIEYEVEQEITVDHFGIEIDGSFYRANHDGGESFYGTNSVQPVLKFLLSLVTA